MIDFYYWPTPNGLKIALMLEECGLAYKLQPVNILAGDQFRKSFLKISPNNRIPAIVDPDGPSGKPVSVFESGAILQYLGDKTGRFYPKQMRARTAVNEWLFWQMGGLGPMAGQAGHFRHYAPRKVPYGVKRYSNEVNRLYGVLDKQLKGKKFVCGKYSIADMAIWPWMRPYRDYGQRLQDFPHMKKWHERMKARPAAVRAVELAKQVDDSSPGGVKEAGVLFNQRARK